MNENLLDELIQRQLDRIQEQVARLTRLAEVEAVRGDALWRWSVAGGFIGGMAAVLLAALWMWVRA